MIDVDQYEKETYTHPQATLSIKSSRQGKIDPDPFRSEFQRDVHRILYSQPFRRLRHKTQVFFLANNDHVCSRLEHSLYVASAARTVARHLKLNEDLAEAIGLGHDVGHAPFGHHGENVLNEISDENEFDIKFNHEVNGLRVVDKLGLLDRETPGLILTNEVRDGIISHCGEEFVNEIIPYNGDKELESIHDRKDAKNPKTLEGCIVKLVDKIVYVGRDLEDGLRAELFFENDIPAEIKYFLGKNNGEIVGTLLEDIITESKKYEDRIIISKEKHDLLVKIYNFNMTNIYLSERSEKYKNQATAALKALFHQLCSDIEKSDFLENRESLPKTSVYNTLDQFIKDLDNPKQQKIEEIIFDFISGMSDNYVNYCIDEIFKPKPVI